MPVRESPWWTDGLGHESHHMGHAPPDWCKRSPDKAFFVCSQHCVKNIMSWPYFVMPAPLWCKSPKNTSLWYLLTIHSKFCNVPIFLHCSSKTIRQKNCSASSLKIQNSLFITFHRENQTVASFLCSRWRGKENYKCRYWIMKKDW